MLNTCRHCDIKFETFYEETVCEFCSGTEECVGTVHGEPCKHGNKAVVRNSDDQHAHCLKCRAELNPDNDDLSSLETWAEWWLQETKEEADYNNEICRQDQREMK